jgi:hypothetical protein
MAVWPKLDEELRGLEPRERYERSFWHYCVEVRGLRHLYEPLHRPVCDWLQESSREPEPYSCLMLPRGHFKTTLASECLTEWSLLCDPDLRFLICHGKFELAKAILRSIKNTFENNEAVREIWPEIVPVDFEGRGSVWTTTQILLNRTLVDRVPSITVGATEAAQVGSHFDRIIHDDLVYKETVGTPEQRQKTRDYRAESEGMWQSEETRVLNVGTRWHDDDAHQELVDGAGLNKDGQQRGPYQGQVRAVVLSCYDEAGEPIFPKVVATVGKKTTRKGFTRAELERKLERNKIYVFSCNYLNDPQVSETPRFRREDVRWFRLTDEGKVPTTKPLNFFLALDLNRTEKTQGDPAALLCGGVDPDGELWVCDWRHGHPSGPQVVLWLREMVKRWKPLKVFVETQNYQLQLLRWLKEDMLRSDVMYRIHPLERSRASTKHERILAMEPFVSAGGLHLREDMLAVVDELERFGVAKHDDLADALADLYAHGRKARPVKVERHVPKNPFTVERVLEDLFLEESRTHSRARIRRVPAWHR